MTPAQKAQKTRAQHDPTWGNKKKCKTSAVYSDPNGVHHLLATFVKENKMTIYKVYEYMILDFILKQKNTGAISTVYKTHKSMLDNHAKYDHSNLKAELE